VLNGLHGTVALILVSALLFAEESGVPLPLVPGDVLLIVAGLLIANGAISRGPSFPSPSWPCSAGSSPCTRGPASSALEGWRPSPGD
jgi:membrane protein DedA with SNARE-associated domain